MTEHGDIRRALEELSSHPPVRDRKREVHERIAVVRRRHNVIGGVTLSVVLLLAGVAFAARPGGRTPEQSAAFSISPSPETIAPPTPEPAASASTSAAAEPDSAAAEIAPPLDSTKPPAGISPAVKATPSEKVTRPSTPTVKQPSTTLYLPPPVVTRTPQASQSATATPKPSPSASPTATASTSPTAPASSSAAPPADAEKLAAEIVSSTVADGTSSPATTLTIRVRGSLYGSIENVTVWFTTTHHLAFTDTVLRPCVARSGELRDVDETFTFKTRYRVAGDQQVEVGIMSLNAECARDTTQRQWLLTGPVNIPVGSTLSNGVEPIALFIDPPRVQDSKITITARSADEDGYASGFEVNWGTGAASQSYPGGNTTDCSASEFGGKFWPGGGGSGTFTSPVVPAGTYTVSITASSTGCAGRDAQTTVQTVTVTVP